MNDQRRVVGVHALGDDIVGEQQEFAIAGQQGGPAVSRDDGGRLREQTRDERRHRGSCIMGDGGGLIRAD
jgi:hypothetical protein